MDRLNKYAPYVFTGPRSVLSWAVLLVLCEFFPLQAQFIWFGQNKVQYNQFSWRILAGEHVDLYYYPEEEEIAYLALKEAEEVYNAYSVKFNHHVFRRIPLIIYSSHHYFEQTNIVSELIPEGVGGFTEFLKGRVALPFNGSFEDFRHVLHHELVHVFQISKTNEVYRLHREKTRARLPLWWTEGLAEYFSTDWDTKADMYLRDLVLNDMVPSIGNLSVYEGSGIIYKLGHSIHRTLVERYGEETIARMYENLWQFNSFEDLFKYIYGLSVEDFSRQWIHSLKKQYYPDIQDKEEVKVSEAVSVATKSWANIHPAVYRSPKTGKQRVVFVSTRTGYLDIYSVLLEKGEKDRKKHIKGGRSAQFESFHPFQTRMDVGPNGVMLLVSKFQDRDAIYAYDLDRNRKVARYQFKGLVGISSPVWGPKQKQIVFSGLSTSGFSDLYTYSLESGKLTRLTNDRYADFYPDWSPDGRYIVFSSDRTAYGRGGPQNLFLYELENGRISYLTVGKWRDSQPRFSEDGTRVAFVSDRTGVPNIFLVDLKGRGGQVTNFYNGLFGFDWTAADSGFCFTALDKQTFGIYAMSLTKTPVDSFYVDHQTKAVQWEWETSKELVEKKQKPEKRPYKRDFTLDFAYGSVGYDPSPYYGGAFSQAVLMFSDMMNDELVLVALGNSATSTADFWESFSGYVTYYNRKNRLNYGYGAFRFAGRFVDLRRDEIFYERSHGVYGLLSYPLSRYYRIETSMGFMKSYRDDFFLNLIRDSFLVTNSISLIKDTALFVPYGPIDGERWNLGLSLTTDISKGRTDNITLMADLRKYFRLSTYSCYAVRLQARYSGGKIPFRELMGGSWTLRGYPRFSILGSRSLLFNQEIRFPLYHRMDLLLGFGRLPLPGIQGAIFFDMGNAWEKGEAYPGLLASTGFGLRMSLGGPMVLRLDRARRILWLNNEYYKTIYRDKYYTNFFFGFDY